MTDNDLRSTNFGKRGKSNFVTNADMQALVVNDLKAFVAALNAIPGQATLKKLSYTVGVDGVAGCDYNFASAANTTEQSIQLGATTVIPADSPIANIVAKATVALVGGTAVADIGSTSGGDEYVSDVSLSSLAAIVSAGSFQVSATAGSVYFSVTPSANWSTLTAGKWKIDIWYFDNSI